MSGGKDSTALLLLAIERGAEDLQAVFADTGHEHPQTYEYIMSGARHRRSHPLGAGRLHRPDRPQARVRGRQLAGVLPRWAAWQEGAWMLRDIPLVDLDADPDAAGQPLEEVPPEPADRFRGGLRVGPWEWIPAVEAVPPIPEAEIAEVIARALAALQLDRQSVPRPVHLEGPLPLDQARFCSKS
ncbi:phosphoadenosine phosphosulfate reductase family protein [Pseudomonas aeruginosa]